MEDKEKIKVDLDMVIVTCCLLSAGLLMANLTGVIEMEILTALGPFLVGMALNILLIFLTMGDGGKQDD